MEPSQTSSKKTISKILFDSTVVLAAITIVSYIMAYIYEVGRATYFFIPLRWVSVGSVYTGFFMAIVLLMIINLSVIIFRLIKITILKKLLLLAYPTYVGYYLFMIPAPKSTGDFVYQIIFFCACFAMFGGIYFSVSDKVQVEKFFQKTQIIPKSYIEYVYPSCVFVTTFFAILLLLFANGRMRAYTTERWYIVSKTNHVMLNVYDENVVCISIDPNNNSFENEIIIYKTSPEKPLHLNYKKIGRIRPKETILYQRQSWKETLREIIPWI